MPKAKTRKSIVRRVKISAKGKVLRGSQYGRHRRARKSKRRIRLFRIPKQMTKKQAKLVKKLINK